MPEKEKNSALDKLRKARVAHLTWRAYAEGLASGLDVSKTPIEPTDCAFGQWFLGEGRQKLGHFSSYEGIRVPHEKLHELYHRIFNIVHAEDTKGLKAFFSTRTGRENARLAHAKQYMAELMGVSESLLEALDILEQDIRDAEECC